MVRFKNRYIVIEVNPVEKLKKGINLRSSLLYNSVITAVQKFHGDFGVAAIRAGLSAKYCNEVTRTALIRLRHGPHRLLSSILPLVNEIGYQKVQVKTLYVGATLKQCYKFLRVSINLLGRVHKSKFNFLPGTYFKRGLNIISVFMILN
uniref:Uncharacterized protein n=1 Tax=Clastoptera arizonana TaxID=38151 RepID=A0A1B6C652_9HEMI